MNVSIEKIEIASFGKLKNAYLTAEKGVNILSAPNESGKSTLAAFIKFVFYGFVGSGKHNVAENEKKLYTPWDSELCEGSITLTADGKKYVVRRRALASGKETCEVADYGTGRLEFVGEVPGEVFFGVSEEVFARTLFFRQLTTPQSKDEILADRLRNIAISADEQVSTKKAIARLSEAKNAIKGRLNSGLLPKAEKERDELEEAITESANLRKEIVRLNEDIQKRASDIAVCDKHLSKLSGERRNLEKYDSLIKLRNIQKLIIEEQAAKAELDEVSARLKQRDDGSAHELIAKNTEYVAVCRERERLLDSLEEAENEAEEIRSSIKITGNDVICAEKQIGSAKKISRILLGIALAAFVIGVIAALASKASMGAGIIIAVAGVICAVVGFVFLAKPAAVAKELGFGGIAELEDALASAPELQKRLKSAEHRAELLKEEYEQTSARATVLKHELDEGISKYVDSSDGNYEEKLQLILRLSAVCGEKQAIWSTKKELLDNATRGVDIDALAEDARDAHSPSPERDKAKVDYEIRFYTDKRSKLSELNHDDEIRLASVEAQCGDPAVLVGKRDSLNARIKDLELKYAAYEAAIRGIEEASDYMKSKVAPRISERADEYFSAATGGKYSSFEIDTRLSMSFGEGIHRSCDYLSAGTRDTAYLSLRLALADMLFGGCGVPILLDDAFVRIDDTRLKMMTGALLEAAKKHQIIIFTHGNREKDAFDCVGAPYSEIAIKTE